MTILEEPVTSTDTDTLTTGHEGVVVPNDISDVLPTRADVVQAFVRENPEATADDVDRLINFFVERVELDPSAGRKAHHIPHAFTKGPFHAIYTNSIPARTASRPGSAHGLLELFVTPAGRKSVTIIHDGSVDGEVNYCRGVVIIE